MKHGLYLFLFALIVFLAAAIGFFIINYNQPAEVLTFPEIKYIKIAGQDIRVELALNKEMQEKGLSGRNSLIPGEGMLFVFEKPGRYPFWMKEMNFPIDIIWLASFEDGGEKKIKVAHIEKNAIPESFPKTFGPDADSQYILEVPAGFAEKNNLQIGDPAVFTY
jgi:hypothetical protein